MDALPPELLCDIFLKTLPCVYSEYHIPYSESLASPLRVSHVSRSLRKLALSFRELWSYLYIDHTEFSRRRKQKMMVEIFDTWLARTNGGPINFMIDADLLLRAAIQDHECAEHILTTLVENQHRKDVYVRCHAVEFSPRFPGFNLTNMPLLTSLSLNLNCYVHSVVNLDSSSRLRRLKIGQVNFDLVAGSQLPYLEQVVICLSSHEQNGTPQRNRIDLSCLELLRNAPSLRCFQISTQTIGPPSPLPLDGGRVLLTGLRELYFELMGECGSHLPATVVDTVTLPSLERLTYHGTIGGEELSRFLQRSAPPLTHLCLGWEDACEERLIDILRLFPELRHLTLPNGKPSCRLLHELTVPDDTKGYTSAADQIILCLRLAYFEICYFPGESRSVWLERLLTMAKSRAFILGTFRTITYYNSFVTTFDRTVAITDIDNYADDIQLGRSITLKSLQGLDDA